MLSLYAMLDAGPTPEMLTIIGLSMGGVFVIVGLITVSVMLIIRALRKKKQKQNDEKED